jgi:hypothetical protein
VQDLGLDWNSACIVPAKKLASALNLKGASRRPPFFGMRRESAFGLIGLPVTIGVTGAPVFTAFPNVQSTRLDEESMAISLTPVVGCVPDA